jgi:hypothetical protein
LKPKITCVFHFWKASCSCSNWVWYHFFALWYREEVYFESSERDTQSVYLTFKQYCHYWFKTKLSIFPTMLKRWPHFGIGKKSILKALKETPNQFSDLSRIECSDIDDLVDLSRKLISRLYDPKGKSKRCHIDLNKLRVKLATVKDSTLVRLPISCEPFLNFFFFIKVIHK